MPQPRIFVSHSHYNSEWCLCFVATLQQRGYDVWYDEKGMSAGAAWVEVLERELVAREIFLIVLTPEAWDAHWVQEELQLALVKRRHIIPVLHQPTPKADGFILSRQWIDVMGKDCVSAALIVSDAISKAPGRNIDINSDTPPIPPPQSIVRPSQGKGSLAKILRPVLRHRQCAWVESDHWSFGKTIADISLTYVDKPPEGFYDTMMPEDIHNALDLWRKENPSRFEELESEPMGAQVRLESASWKHTNDWKHVMTLSPTKYLYYVAIQSRLGATRLKSRKGRSYMYSLRKKYFGEVKQHGDHINPMQLPNNFAVHLCVVSSDGHLLLRQRPSLKDTEIYPLAWEAGVGELMHGPVDIKEGSSGFHKKKFPAFTPEGSPDMSLFLRNAIAEEVNYYDARSEDFLLFGYAVEFDMLSPRLIGVYTSDLDINALKQYAENAKDSPRTLDEVPLTLEGLASICTKYTEWGPTSKLVMLLALRCDLKEKGLTDQVDELDELLGDFKEWPRSDPLAQHGNFKWPLFFLLPPRSHAPY